MQRFCFVVPVYRHSSTLAAVLDALRPHGLPIIVVDDGNSLAEHQVIVEACEAFNNAVSLTARIFIAPMESTLSCIKILVLLIKTQHAIQVN